LKLLLVAPEIAPPWTEGRKKLVYDLAEALTEIVTLRLITTGDKKEELKVPCPGYRMEVRSRWQKLHILHKALNDALVVWRPDAVCHFPFGSFHGLRGLANRWSIRHIDQRCESHGLRCLTILYSITKGSIQTLKKRARELVLAPGRALSELNMAMGINLSKALCVVSNPHEKPTLLFMAGLQEPRHSILEHVLNERGLEDVVEAGPYFEAAGIRVIVAIPLLRDSKLRDELSYHFTVKSPNLDLDLRPEVSVPEIFQEVDLYLFPYRVELTQFIPTSILEAMAAGVPVVLSDLLMLSPLANGGRTAYQFRRYDAHHLWEVVSSALADEDGRQKMALRAREFVQAKWSIDRTVQELLNILNYQKASRSQN
jgi:glycosyltransferase involved in cell wall biosynthesis